MRISMDSRFRGNDNKGSKSTFYERIILAVSYFAAVYLGENLKLKMLVERIYLVSKRFFGVPTFFNYAIADGLYNLLFPDKTGIKIVPKNKSPDFQLCFNFCDETG